MPWGRAFEQKLSAQFKCPAYARPPPLSSLTLTGALNNSTHFTVHLLFGKSMLIIIIVIIIELRR